jgi:hypothetical protein
MCVLNAVVASPSVQITSDIENLMTKISARTGGSNIDSLGKIGTVLDSHP